MTVTCNYRSTAVIILPGVYLPPQRNATVADDAFSLLFISIHAPREGSDQRLKVRLKATKNFNPRSPRGERPPNDIIYSLNLCISIHAPREGSDQRLKVRLKATKNFNPRSPRGERPPNDIIYSLNLCISIHAPREGSDVRGGDKGDEGRRISIHAPREGSD